MQCQKVRAWVHARSKAKLTDETLAQLQDTPDNNFSRGLGTFGNNMPHFAPRCITDKYFDWMQKIIHGDRELPLHNGDVPRAYCCCIDMRTGQVYDNDPDTNCVYYPVCEEKKWECRHAYDKQIGREIYEEGRRREEEQG